MLIFNLRDLRQAAVMHVISLLVEVLGNLAVFYLNHQQYSSHLLGH